MKNLGFYQVVLLVIIALAVLDGGAALSYQKSTKKSAVVGQNSQLLALVKTKKETPPKTARNDFGCWPSSCSSISSPRRRQLCKNWKAGKPVQWPSDCSHVGGRNCTKLCNSETIASKPKGVFPAGLYYVQPALDHPGGKIRILNGTIPRDVDFTAQGFDVSPDFIATAEYDSDSQMSDIVLWRADGSTQRVAVAPGLYGVTRPSLSPDATRVAVQATETPFTPPSNMPQYLSVYIIELATGKWTRLVPLSSDPATGNELPKWFPSSDRIAHQGIEFVDENGSQTACQVIRVYDVASALPVLTIRRNGTTGCYQPINGVEEGPRFHFAVSQDSARLIIVGEMQIYDAKTGSLLSDIHQKVMDALSAAGYTPDARFPGQGGGGTFPLDGTFSPDGKSIVFDGAVQKNGAYGVLLMQVNTDGTGFTILQGPIQVTPEFSNNHNYSQVNPNWK